MKRLLLFFVDLCLLIIATLIAIILRDNLEFSLNRLTEFSTYFAATALCATVVLPVAGLDKSMWRFSTLADYIRVCLAVLAVSLGALLITFATNRLDGVARSLPLLQILAGTALLISARVFFRVRHNLRRRNGPALVPLQITETLPKKTVLVVGIGRLAELYLQSIEELAPGSVRIAGVLGRGDHHVGRRMGAYSVLGLPEDIADVLARLELHGVTVDSIVVASPLRSLSAKAHGALFEVANAGSISVRILEESLGFVADELASADGYPSTSPSSFKATATEDQSFVITPAELVTIASRPYWLAKRLFDACMAGVLMIVLAPLILLVGLLVGFKIGFPVIFWQQRPGLGGRPFRLYKFKTMAAAHTADGRRRSDQERTPWIGGLLRRTRLDELPQLFNILRGDMSFVGPRPLLPRDQSEAFRARLLVRPGLTGWAQVVGGRAISAETKAALDIWYVRQSSFRLDFEIALRTIKMVMFGEVTDNNLIRRTWNELLKAGVLRGRVLKIAEQRSS
jgi:lipopolysaccharide/colanic/teichoic acid biosynthesis glycosyltransferase